MKRAHVEALLGARAAKRAAALVTRMSNADGVVLDGERLEDAAGKLPREVLDAAGLAFRTDRAAVVEAGGERYFIQVQNPALRMLIVGAVHIAQALTPMARLAGYAVTLIDARRAFATPERFPGVDLAVEWPDTALERLAPDARSAVVTLTHDPKFDDPALEVALRSSAFYVGSLGSKRTHAARCERLRARGLDETALARIHAPVGLDIGARSQAEIAIAVLAQATQALRKPPDAAHAADR